MKYINEWRSNIVSVAATTKFVVEHFEGIWSFVARGLEILKKFGEGPSSLIRKYTMVTTELQKVGKH